MSAPRLRPALLAPLMLLLAISASLAEPRKGVRVEVDTAEVPELKAWGDDARKLVEKWYPRVSALLGSKGFVPPHQVRIVFKKDMDGVAFTSGKTITIAAKWVKAHPDDFGMVIHEMTHVIQSYPPQPGRAWLVEGIADYVRFYHFEPKSARPRVNPKRASYRDGYRTTAAFLAWVEKRYHKGLVPELNQALREKTYSDALFQQRTGKSLDQLWTEFVGTLLPSLTDINLWR